MAQPETFTFFDRYRAYCTCRRGKRATRKAQRYEMQLLDQLCDTAHALNTGEWRPSRAHRFVVIHPKPREILAASFADRVVHHTIVPWFERRFEPVFIADSYANRIGKGTHAAVRRLQAMTRSVPAGYYLQLDIRNFFNSVHRPTLFRLLRERVGRDARRRAADPRYVSETEAVPYLRAARALLTGSPAHNAIAVGSAAHRERVPVHKCLGNAPAETGLPIGNLTSQFFGNVYLNGLDQFIKHTLTVRRYVRYVDDFVLLAPDAATLREWHTQIEHYLREQLRLALRPDFRIAPISSGIDFLGFVVRPAYLLVRRRVIAHLCERLHAANAIITARAGRWQFPPALRESLSATLASYRGHFKHGRVGTLYADLLARFPWLRLFGWRGCPRTPPMPHAFYIRRPRDLGEQVAAVRARFPGAVCRISVGNRRLIYPPLVAARAATGSAPWVKIAEGARLHPRLRSRYVVAMSAKAEPGAAPSASPRRTQANQPNTVGVPVHPLAANFRSQR